MRSKLFASFFALLFLSVTPSFVATNAMAQEEVLEVEGFCENGVNRQGWYKHWLKCCCEPGEGSCSKKSQC